MQRLILDPQSGFMYLDLKTDTLLPCEGIMQVVVSVPCEADQINVIPFLPYQDESAASTSRAKNYRMSCKKCFLKQKKDLCPHSLEEQSFRGTCCLCEIFHAYTLAYVILVMEEAYIFTEMEKIFHHS